MKISHVIKASVVADGLKERTHHPSSLFDPALKLMFFVDVQNNTVEGSLKVGGNS